MRVTIDADNNRLNISVPADEAGIIADGLTCSDGHPLLAPGMAVLIRDKLQDLNYAVEQRDQRGVYFNNYDTGWLNRNAGVPKALVAICPTHADAVLLAERLNETLGSLDVPTFYVDHVYV